ncbi:hypothetical protein JXM67_13185 [candidate division WOR-3 bacterium]|nr:hypothetical protein [candidate division WOR-3 bacterium]
MNNLKSLGLVTCILLFSSAVTEVKAEDYTKRFVRGVFAGNLNSTQDKSNYNALHLNFFFGETADLITYPSVVDFCSDEGQTQHAVATYSIAHWNPNPISLENWKTTVVSKELADVDAMKFVNLCGHFIGEEAPEFYDKIYFDAMSYVIPKVQEKWPGDLITCHANQGSTRPDLFLWVKDIDVAWVYPYPYYTTYHTEDSWYQDSLQYWAVDYYNKVANQFKMFRQWGLCPNLIIRVCPQSWYKAYTPGNEPDHSHERKPSREEMMFESWLAFSRGAKGFAPFRYQNDDSESASGPTVSGHVGLVDDGPNEYPNDHNHENQFNLGPGSTYYDSESDFGGAWNADDMFLWQAEIFHQFEQVDNRLKVTFNCTNGLYVVDMDTFKSVHGDLTTPLFFVRQITVEPPPGATEEDVYTEISLHHSVSPYNHNIFLLLNRSLTLTQPVEYDITLQHMLEGNPKVVNLVTGSQYFPELQGDEYTIHVTLDPGEAGLFLLTNGANQGNERELYLCGHWVASLLASDPMGTGSSGNDLGYAYCRWEWLKGKPDPPYQRGTWKHPCGEEEWEKANSPLILENWSINSLYGCFNDIMDAECMNYVEVFEHTQFPYEHLDDIKEGMLGTKSNVVTIVKPEDPGGCPEAYSFIYRDTTLDTGYFFIEANTILPFSETPLYPGQKQFDLLKLDFLNVEAGHYYLNLLENDDETTQLFGGALWVVDHPQGTEVATSTDSNIYVYSDKVAPVACVDNNSLDCLDEVKHEDDKVYMGEVSSYITATFPSESWEHKGLLITLGSYDGDLPHPVMPKGISLLAAIPDGHGGWTPKGEGTTRKNVSQWLIDVSDADSNTFRITCGGDSCGINCVELVKLDTTNVTITEASLDSAVIWLKDSPGSPPVGYGCANVLTNPESAVVISPHGQLALSFTEVAPDITRQRDFVLQTTGYYEVGEGIGGGGGGAHGSEDILKFDLDVKTLNIGKNSMMINYSVPYVTDVKIRIVDITGRVVAEPVKGEVDPGRYQVKWDYKDDAGRKVASGVYFIKMTTSYFEETNKIVLTK